MYGSTFIRHFIFAMEAMAHDFHWAEISTTLLEFLDDYSAKLRDETGKLQKRKICYNYTGNMRHLFFNTR